jgi:hypothetical protein
MSVLLFELKEEHVKLIKQLRWCMKDNIVSGIADDGDEFAPPFGENNIYDAIDLILNGHLEEFDPLNEEIKEYPEEQKKEWDALYSELPTALDIILYNGHFETGLYRTKFHIREWKKTR